MLIKAGVGGCVRLRAGPIRVSELATALTWAQLFQVGNHERQAGVNIAPVVATLLPYQGRADRLRVVRALIQRWRASGHVQAACGAILLPLGDTLSPQAPTFAPVRNAVRFDERPYLFACQLRAVRLVCAIKNLSG